MPYFIVLIIVFGRVPLANNDSTTWLWISQLRFSARGRLLCSSSSIIWRDTCSRVLYSEPVNNPQFNCEPFPPLPETNAETQMEKHFKMINP